MGTLNAATDPGPAQRDRRALEAEVNATVKHIMLVCEELASMDPREAADLHTFNARRHAVIRRVWNLVNRSIEYGTRSVQRDEPLE